MTALCRHLERWLLDASQRRADTVQVQGDVRHKQ
jgi:hypothetical protein